jgi:glycosyltransferase involved in cell wall biosynthesis
MKPKIALVHHWLVSPGGAERVLYELHKMYPDAPIYTAAYSPQKFPEFATADVRTTWLDKVPFAKTKHQLFPVLRGLAFKMLDLSEYDVVISSCAAEAKYVTTGPNTLHICYCHTPVRYYWSDYQWYLQHPPFGKLNWLAGLVLPAIIGQLRRTDYEAAQNVDVYLANSRNVQDRIQTYYHRNSTVIYPPIQAKQLAAVPSAKPRSYYLIVGRQVAYKRLDLAVDAFNHLGLSLKVAGTGEEIERQRARAYPNIEFLGYVSDKERDQLFAGAKGFIFPPEEDFGMVPIEAMAAGAPVVAYNKGGAPEYVVDGVTGVLFNEQTVDQLVAAVRRLEAMKLDEAAIRRHAQTFDASVFRHKMAAFVEAELAKFRTSRR